MFLTRRSHIVLQQANHVVNRSDRRCVFKSRVLGGRPVTTAVSRHNAMNLPEERYLNYVNHPRYGRGPRYTGRNPDPFSSHVSLHWNATSITEITQVYQKLTGQTFAPLLDLIPYDQGAKRIPNTAVNASPDRQLTATVAITHYFDLDRVCRDCLQPFIFFADEQKYWYEDLGFRLDADCVRCVQCRKRHRTIADARRQYETLFHILEKTTEQTLEMAACCLQLIADGVFTRKQTQRIRMLLNKAKRTASEIQCVQVSLLSARVSTIESQSG